MKAPLKSNLRISDICFLCYILCKCALCWALSFIVFYYFYLCRVVPNLVCCDKRRCWCPSGLPRGRAWLFLSKNIRSLRFLLGRLSRKLSSSLMQSLNLLRRWYGILLLKLFWPTVRKIVLVIEKNFEITRTIYSNSGRSEQFLVT